MTFNHGSFIKEAMDGIMMQQVNFNVEVVVGDDFSKDRTLEIIRGYENTQNIHIRILDRKTGDDYWKERQEKGRLYNFVNILENCHGKYIALLDGDDYWTDPLKLKKQVDFLDTHPQYSVCYHEVNVIDKNGNHDKRTFENMKHDYSVREMFVKMVPHTSTLVFRNSPLSFSPDFFTIVNADNYLMAKLAAYGMAKYLPDFKPSFYRHHENGLWTTMDRMNKLQSSIRTFEVIRADVSKPYKKYTDHVLFGLELKKYQWYKSLRMKKEQSAQLKKILAKANFNPVRIIRLVKVALR